MFQLGEEWKGLPNSGSHRLPVTASIPYFFKWKLHNIRMLLYNLEKLRDDFDVESADPLYTLIHEEAESLCQILFRDINKSMEARAYYDK